MIYILLICFLIVFFVISGNMKKLKLNCVTMINGGPKTGKSTLVVTLAIKQYKKNLRKYRIRKYLLFRWFLEKPLLYSNIPLTIPYVPLTEDLILRKKRFRYGSVVILIEASLVADSQMYKDGLLNEQISLFIKLYGHETMGGSMYIDTQSVEDNHYAIKRCLDKYLYIHHLTKWVPFILIFKVREMAYSSDNQTAVNVFNEDIEDSMKTLICTKKVWKIFDAYCYSVFTDDLEVVDNVLPKDKKRCLKAPNLVTFKNYATLNLRKECEVCE